MALNMYLRINDLNEQMPDIMNQLSNDDKFDLMFKVILLNAPHCGFLSKNKYTDNKIFLID